MDDCKEFNTLLIFPPVWTPVTPYLALPLLIAYLRKEGLRASQYDASLAFFLEYLLKPKTLMDLLHIIGEREEAGVYFSASEEDKALLRDIREHPQAWDERIMGVSGMVNTLRDGERFYDPAACIAAQSGLYELLRLASLACYPASFTFNTFSNPEITDFQGMLKYSEDEAANPFLRFYNENLPGKMDEERPSLVGISISTSHQLAGALTLARFIRRQYPAVHVTLGGKHVLRLKEALLEAPAYFSEFCHSLVLDNGERPLRRLIEQLASRGPLGEVPNLVYLHEDRLAFTEMGPHEPISALPTADFSDLPLQRYLSPTPIIPIRLSEGCYWGKCTFCSRYDNKRFQTVPPENAVGQMDELQQRYGVSCFTVNDDCLTPTYLEAISRLIVEKGLHFQISLWCKPVGTFTRSRLQLLSKAGVRLIRWGVETGHPRILQLMNKGTNLNDTVRVLRDASNAGIWNHATMILGFPTETEEEAEETIRFLDWNQDIIHSSIFFRFVLLNHSYIINHPEEFSIQRVEREESLFSYEHRFRASEGMDAETLSTFLSRAQKYRLEDMYRHPFWFYLRIREYLLLYAARHGVRRVLGWKVDPEDFSITKVGGAIRYFFQRPEEVPPDILEKIFELVERGGEVGLSWVRNNLKEAFLIGYAMEGERVVGTMTHKKPLSNYVRQIEEKTHLDLHGYLERGYTSVRPEYRHLGVGDRLLKGLVERSPGKKIYVTINVDNLDPIKLTLRNHMRLAATYHNERTGHEIGVFINR